MPGGHRPRPTMSRAESTARSLALRGNSAALGQREASPALAHAHSSFACRFLRDRHAPAHRRMAGHSSTCTRLPGSEIFVSPWPGSLATCQSSAVTADRHPGLAGAERPADPFPASLLLFAASHGFLYTAFGAFRCRSSAQSISPARDASSRSARDSGGPSTIGRNTHSMASWHFMSPVPCIITSSMAMTCCNGC